jgi:hypothetical protein
MREPLDWGTFLVRPSLKEFVVYVATVSPAFMRRKRPRVTLKTRDIVSLLTRKSPVVDVAMHSEFVFDG